MEVASGIGTGDGEWQCGFCFQGLPKLDDLVRTRSLKYHIKTYHEGETVQKANLALAKAHGIVVGNKKVTTNALTTAVHWVRRQKEGVQAMKSQGHLLQRLFFQSQARHRRATRFVCSRCCRAWINSAMHNDMGKTKCGGAKERAKILAYTAGDARRKTTGSSWRSFGPSSPRSGRP